MSWNKETLDKVKELEESKELDSLTDKELIFLTNSYNKCDENWHKIIIYQNQQVINLLFELNQSVMTLVNRLT